jgi:hypothetical protein
MRHRPTPTLAAALLATVLLPARAAHADVIDGNWCHADGRHMSIKGPDIVTSSGAHLAGDYTRHSFAYVVPTAEPGAGQTVSMILINEMTVHLTMRAEASGAAPGPVQIWVRCAPRVSALRRTTPWS